MSTLAAVPPWDALVNLLPEAAALEKRERELLCGLIRRELLSELQDELESQAVFRPEDIPELSAFIRSLPSHGPGQIDQMLADLSLTAEEAGLEKAGWAFRHQSRKGEILAGDRLLPFQLIRLHPYTFVLVSPAGSRATLAQAFAAAFGLPPSVASTNTFSVEGQPWSAWAWCLDPDPAAAQEAIEQIGILWRAGQS